MGGDSEDSDKPLAARVPKAAKAPAAKPKPAPASVKRKAAAAESEESEEDSESDSEPAPAKKKAPAKTPVAAERAKGEAGPCAWRLAAWLLAASAFAATTGLRRLPDAESNARSPS